jgi:hypothetical protein
MEKKTLYQGSRLFVVFTGYPIFRFSFLLILAGNILEIECSPFGGCVREISSLIDES